jgi:hypothetical protein
MKNQQLQWQFKNLLHFSVACDERILKVNINLLLAHWSNQILHMPLFNGLTELQIEESLQQIAENY